MWEFGFAKEKQKWFSLKMNALRPKELQEKYRQLYSKVKAVEKADNMTDNQLMAWVRDYYHSNV